jgi:RNA polymerase sigma-70 factor (ECF subfamily)
MTDTNDPVPSAAGEHFVQQLTDAQSQVYACICALLGGTRDARDVLQETNLVLWRKAAEYDPRRDFLAWAYTFARFQVMAHLKKQSRNRMVFDEAMVDRIAAVVAERNVDLQDRLRLLDDCIRKLPHRHRALLESRYQKGESVQELTTQFGKTATALGVLLHRIRLTLAECIERSSRSSEGP